MDILKPEQYEEYERFAQTHPAGGITQSVLWHAVKSGWGREIVVSRSPDGAIVGGVSVLVRRAPFFGAALLYSPRGPVCDYGDQAVLRDLMDGINALAKKHRAYTYKMDPDVPEADKRFAALAKELGFTCFQGADGFETIQARFNYRLYFEGRSEEQLLANVTQQTRRNIRLAQRHGVEVRIVGEERLEDFMRLMRETGERDGFTVRSKEYFAGMLRALGEHCRLYMAFYEGKPLSGAITTNYAGKTCYIYGASTSEHRNVMPGYLLQWEMIRWAIETGCTVYDFQGVSGKLDDPNHHLYGLYRFKKGFNGTLDTLAGEFDRTYRPFTAWLIGRAIDAEAWLRGLRRRLRGVRH